jgi:ribokinase
VLGGTLLQGPGGKGANQAVAAARAGASVVFVTAVGDDDFGRQALANYRAEGIDVSRVSVRSGAASGVALILVGEAGENMIGVASGANGGLLADQIADLPASLFVSGGVLLLAGMEGPLDAIARAVDRGASAGMRLILNPAPAASSLAEQDWLGRIEIMTPNRGELALLSVLPTSTRDEVVSAAQALRARGVGRVVATLGAEGSVIVDQGCRWIPAHKVEAVDTVGAGDAFTGVLAVGLAEGRSLESAAAMATAAAALAVTRPGAQAALPRRDAIEQRLATSHES